VSRARPAAAAILAASLAAPAVPARAAPPGSPWGERYFPNVELVTHDGRKVRFYDDLIRDKHVVVSFIYTSCQRVCGLMTANLARVQRELGERVGTDIHFYSISMDPEHDTPAVLKAYAEAFKARPGWTFLTGAPDAVALLRKKFGDLAPVEDHAPRINVGNDEAGQWWSTSALETPTYLATMIGGWMDPDWDGSARVTAKSYARVPGISAPGPGQKVYRQKCAACHVRGGEGVGPDLTGVVARRGEAWLSRWIQSPEAMAREGDPAARELRARSEPVRMPNLGLSPGEVRAVIEYLKTEEAAAKPAIQAAAGVRPAPAGGAAP
jgi:protein SCO1/2